MPSAPRERRINRSVQRQERPNCIDAWCAVYGLPPFERCVAVGLRVSQSGAIEPRYSCNIVFRSDSEADSTSRPQFDASAEHRTIILPPCNPADHKRSKSSMAHEIQSPNGTAAPSYVAARNKEITLRPYGDPGIYQVEQNPAPGSREALLVKIGVNANCYETMPVLR